MENFLTSRRKAESPLTVSELTARLRSVIEGEFARVQVEGEITGWLEASSGHCYFTLKDHDAVLSSVMWRSTRQRLRFRPADGLKVVCSGKLSLYEKRGQYQLVVDGMTEAGEGDLWARFQKLKARLEAEGLFAADRKRALPVYPRRIGIVTSPTGAVIRDMLSVLRRRAPGVSVLLYPARVQGRGAALELATGLRALGRVPDLDLIIIGRGGGSIEDLWEFNDEGLARQIAASPIPVISAVGHETDFTICDFVADVRAGTPSIAAQMVSSGYSDLRHRVESALARCRQQVTSGVRDQRRRVTALLGSYALRRPENRVRESIQRVDDLMERLPRLVAQRAERLRARLARANATVDAHNPALIQARGYVIVRRSESGGVITHAKDVTPGAGLRLQFQDGEASAQGV